MAGLSRDLRCVMWIKNQDSTKKCDFLEEEGVTVRTDFTKKVNVIMPLRFYVKSILIKSE